MRLLRIDTPALKVENQFARERADGRAVRAFNIVGENLQLRPRIDRRLVGDFCDA